MIVLHLEALAGIALSLSILMATGWLAQRRTGERYRDYQARTSAFFPLPPHKGAVP